ncbi:MAG TPA: DUF3800 domain-containing protein [Gammaproteobacteria bacterium]|nr:DUF3800 domain-containing protein [Gammaproteobacteria bacterium]
MQLFFIDESGTIPPKEKNDGVDYFTLGGIMIPEDFWHELDKELAGLKARFGVDGEIKWRYFSPQKQDAAQHSLSHLSGPQKEELRLGIYHSVKGVCSRKNS